MRTFATIMIDVVSIVQVKAYARQGGLFLSLAWLVSFALILLVPKSSWGGLVAMSSPFLVGWLLQRFRNEALDGAISFRRALVFSCLTFFYASMIFALVQYVYFRFLDHGLFLTNIVNQAGLLAEVYKQNGMPTTDITEGLTLMGQLSPIELAFLFMMQNIFIGWVVSLPVALFCKKKQR